MSAKERLAYELSIAAERDLAACMATSFEEGEEKGIAKGITEGMRKIILNMKQAGVDLATIAKTAGLPEKEVEALLKWITALKDQDELQRNNITKPLQPNDCRGLFFVCLRSSQREGQKNFL